MFLTEFHLGWDQEHCTRKSKALFSWGYFCSMIPLAIFPCELLRVFLLEGGSLSFLHSANTHTHTRTNFSSSWAFYLPSPPQYYLSVYLWLKHGFLWALPSPRFPYHLPCCYSFCCPKWSFHQLLLMKYWRCSDMGMLEEPFNYQISILLLDEGSC